MQNRCTAQSYCSVQSHAGDRAYLSEVTLPLPLISGPRQTRGEQISIATSALDNTLSHPPLGVVIGGSCKEQVMARRGTAAAGESFVDGKR